MKSLTQFITEELDTDNLFWLLDKWFERNEKQAQEFVEIIVKCKQDGQKVNIDNLKKYLKAPDFSTGGELIYDENELEKIKPVLESIYKILEKSGFEFAYRTAKEIRLYAIASYETCEDKSQFNINSVIDQQIVQKILPKIHGNKKQIGSMLVELKTELEENEYFELSQAKVSSMLDKLEKYQYASFI